MGRRVVCDQTAGLFVQIAIARRELVAKCEQRKEIDLVGAVRVGRVAIRLNVRRVVVKQVEHEMTLVLVRADDVRIGRHVIGNERVGA